MIRRLFAYIVYLIAILLLLLVFCVGSVVGYIQSSKWFLENVDLEQAEKKTFLVAFESNDPSETKQLHVTFLRQLAEEHEKFPKLSFHIIEKVQYYAWAGNNAKVKTKTEANGSQLIQIFVTGDTPWSSLSEYRVIKNTIYPLRHAQASPMIFLLLLILGLIIVALISKPLRRVINRIFQVETSG